MAIVSGGGMDREWTRPLRTDGTVDSDDPALDGMVGTHQGEFVGYNIFGAQPGCEYVWERTRLQDKIRVQQRGGHIVQGGDPERSGFSQFLDDDGLSGTPLDSADATNELMLVRYSVESIRRKREAEQAKANAMRRGGAEDFADKADARERQYSGGKPSRFRRSDHAIDFKDDNERMVDQWVPEDGILPVG